MNNSGNIRKLNSSKVYYYNTRDKRIDVKYNCGVTFRGLPH